VHAVLLDGTGREAALVGGKASALDRLIAWGQTVPPTAVATADAFRAVVAQPALAGLMERIASGAPILGDEVDEAFLDAGLPADVLDQIGEAARQVGHGGPLAIRSSATVEDMAHSSFAGQYRSLLDVSSTDRDAIERAVLGVFASLFHPAPRAYRAALGVDSRGIAMAAVMMAMVEARRAGVLFTIDPTVVEPTMRIEVVDGLGESLVSGRRTPQVHQIPRSGDVASAVGSDSSLEQSLLAVLDAGLEIERRAGGPQDIEWAWDGSTLWIVQARPVTARRRALDDPFSTDGFDDDPDELHDVELTTEGIGEMLPDVLAPLVWQLASFVAEEGFRIMLDRLGGDLGEAADPHWLVRRVRGRAALDVGRLSAAMAPIPGAARRVRAAYFGDEHAPSDAAGSPRRRIVERWEATRHRRRAEVARRRATFDAEVVLRAVSAIAEAVDAHAASADQLLARHLELVALSARAMAAELTVSADAGAIHAALRTVLARYLSSEDAAHWADRVTVPPPLPPALPSSSASVFAGPTWLELGIAPTTRRPDHDAVSMLADLETHLESAARWPAPGLRRRLIRRRVEHLAQRARRQFARRESTKAALLVLGGEVRSLHLEFGRRLVDAGVLLDPLDVDLLTVEELRSCLLPSGATRVGVPSLQAIDRRRRVLQRQQAGSALPSQWRGMPPDEPAVARSSGAVFTGWAVSGGRFIGRARRVTGPEGPIGRDEVLVASATDPSWSPILLRCGAMVLERGGPLSHAAILAREFGLPAVCNLPGAVAALDGRLVLVDGDLGTVALLDVDGTDGRS
ncbi:MAG: hypothetical protein RI958_652, partial [Actinomycetota bacterium]